jgi:hypothetical protein
LFTIFGCKQEQPRGTELPVIDIVEGIEASEDTPMMWSEIADDITFIPLETTDECLIGDDYEICLKNNHIVVIDNTSQIYLFDKTGKFIRKIGSRGQGPGEYLLPRFPVIVNDELFIYDPAKKLCYDLLTGECLRTKRHSEDYEEPTYVWCFNDSVLVYYFPYLISGDPKEFAHIQTLSLDFEIANKLWYEELKPKLKPGETSFTVIPGDDPIIFSKDENRYILHPKPEQKIVFLIDKNLETTPVYQIYTGKYDFDGNSGKESYAILDIVDTEKFIFMSLRWNGYIVYDKTTGKSKHTFGFFNDFDKSFQGFDPHSQAFVARNILCTAVYPSDLKEIMSGKYYEDIKIKNKEKHQAIKDYLDSAKDDDNPIIFLITLK